LKGQHGAEHGLALKVHQLGPNRRLRLAEQRRALELLAGAPRGATKARLLADGFTVDMLADLIREGLATAQRETMRVGSLTIKVERYRITDDGRRAIES
jgi:hypothetical protein